MLMISGLWLDLAVKIFQAEKHGLGRKEEILLRNLKTGI